MKILCLALPATGHIDFGGGGYLKLAASLQARGHQVHWLTGGAQVNTIRAANMPVKDEPLVRKLAFFTAPLGSIGNPASAEYRDYIGELQQLFRTIKSEKADAILLDRLLVYGALVAEELDIPYAAIGTPGGQWDNHQGIALFSEGPVQKFHAIGAQVANEIGWGKSGISSMWIDSPFLNICFVGKTFYSYVKTPSERGAFIHHYGKKQHKKRRSTIGISFGNTGKNIEPLIHTLRSISRLQGSENIEVITGGNEDLNNQTLTREFSSPSTSIMDWANFKTFIPRLRYLAFFGGIGTIWCCIDNNTPMLVVPGLTADQVINAGSVARLGIGEVVNSAPFNFDKARLTVESMQDNRKIERIREAIRQFKHHSNYTDNMESACSRIEKLGK